MSNFADVQRTHTCGELRTEHVGQTVRLNGWLHRWRDHGGLLFLDLRDRYGVTQVTFRPDGVDAETYKTAAHVRAETVVAISGTVQPRPEGMANPEMPTGEIEVVAASLTVLNPSKTPPFEIEEETAAAEDLRLEYRYLDLRRNFLKDKMILRHRVTTAIREHLDREGFLEIETPLMMRSTPEGARDYVVPSRVFKGKFYALPQSPQLLKQILMIAGFDKYFQLARCLRDEDLRADRQPEHTQIDMEMSFVTMEDIFSTVERLMKYVFESVLDVRVKTPFPRLTYREAMDMFGIDKPDTRYQMVIVDLSEAVAGSEFKVFADTVARGGVVKAICARGQAGLSRKQVGDWEKVAKAVGAKGLAYVLYQEEGPRSPILKFIDVSELDAITERTGAQVGDAVFLVADNRVKCEEILGRLRIEMAKAWNLADPKQFNFLWVYEFPLFEYNEEAGRFDAMHNIVTAPYEEDIPLLEKGQTADVAPSDPRHPWARIRANQYDLVLNGVEIASGGIRNHRRDLQQKILNILGIDDARAERMFGFLLKALEYGAPPHGGIAPGLDRIIAVMSGSESIRDVIAFPKTTAAQSLMDGAPTDIDEAQLRELGLRIVSET